MTTRDITRMSSREYHLADGNSKTVPTIYGSNEYYVPLVYFKIVCYTVLKAILTSGGLSSPPSVFIIT